MIFAYEAANSAGGVVAGEVEAVNRKEAIRELKNRGLVVTDIHGVALEAETPSGKSSARDLLLSLHEMATLLESGVSVVETIDAQSRANYPPDLRHKYQAMANEIRKGGAFSEALRIAQFDLPGYFNQLVKAGELTGNLALSLREGVNQFEYDLKMAEELRSALIYPAILVLSGIAAILLIFVFVVPKFAPLVSRAEDLPLLSDLVLSGGMWFNDNLLLFFCLVAAAAGAGAYALTNRSLRARALAFAFRLPVIGAWLSEGDTATWTSLMSTLLNSRVDLLLSMDLARQSMRSERRKRQLDQVMTDVKAGQGLADSLEKARALTPTGYNLIRSGERTGKLPDMMRSVAKLYDETARTRMKRAMALIEPLAILIIGGVIGLVILGVILAITSVNELVV